MTKTELVTAILSFLAVAFGIGVWIVYLTE